MLPAQRPVPWHGLFAKRWFFALLLLLLVFAAYGPALTGPFFFDDEHFIVRNEMVHDLGRIVDIYASNTTSGSFISGNFYRPNQQCLYALLYRLVGVATPVPYHLTSVALHGVAGILLLTWLMLLGFGTLAAAAGALVFSLHPVQSEAVAYISGMSDPLAIVFLLSGLICYTRGVQHRLKMGLGWLAFALLFFVLALLSRENALVFAPILCVLTLFLRRNQPNLPLKRQLLVVGLFCSFAALYLILKLTLLNFQHTFGLTDQVNVYTSDIWVRLTTFVNVLWDYAVLLFFPTHLFYEKPYRAYLSLWEWRGLFGLAVIALLAFTILFARRYPRFALGLTIAASALLPFCGAVPLNAMFLEHWLYIPMVGVAILVAALLQNYGHAPHRKILAPLFVLTLSLLFVRTHLRARQWGDVEKFYLNEVENGGASLRILNNLAMYYADHNEPAKAEEYYKKAIFSSGSAEMPQPHHNLARIYLDKGALEQAMAELHKALLIDHHFVYSLALLTQIFEASGDQRRLSAAREALRLVYAGKEYDYPALESLLFQ